MGGKRPKCRFLYRPIEMEKPAKPYAMRVFDGALKQTRTADLVLTKDALYLLSYESIFNFPGKKSAPHFAPHGDELR